MAKPGPKPGTPSPKIGKPGKPGPSAALRLERIEAARHRLALELPEYLDKLRERALGLTIAKNMLRDGTIVEIQLPPDAGALQFLISHGIGRVPDPAQEALALARAEFIRGQIESGLAGAQVGQLRASAAERLAYLETYKLSLVDERVVEEREKVMVSRFLAWVSKTLVNEIGDMDRRQFLLESAGSMLEEAHGEASVAGGTPFDDPDTMNAEIVEDEEGDGGSGDGEALF